jgi:hypothetical protein
MVEIPELSPVQVEAHKTLAAKGVFVENGDPTFAILHGEWKREGDGIMNTNADASLWAASALRADGDFQVRARLTLSAAPTPGAGFVFKDGYGLQENTIGFDGGIAGPSLAAGATNQMAARIRPGEPFELDVVRQGTALTVRINGTEAARATLNAKPVGRFGFRAGKNTLRIQSFAASGGLDDGLAMRRQIEIGLWIDKYINARTYRGVYRLFITDDGEYTPEGGLAPKPSPGRYFAQLKNCGVTPEQGYALNAAVGIGLIGQTWMPGAGPTNPVLHLAMAQDAVRSAGLQFRSTQYRPVVLRIEPGPLKGRWFRSYEGKIQWRVVGFAPYGEGREEWSPFFLLRRPFVAIPPLGAAQVWLNVDSTKVPPGEYTSLIRIAATDWEGRQAFPERTVTLRVRVAPVRIAPARPILLHGWVNPPPGEKYLLDWFKRFNVWQGPFFSKAAMAQYGLQLQIWCQRHTDSNQVRRQIADAKALGLGYDDWMFSILDEPTGQSAQELKEYLTIGKMIRDADPKVKITMNPGEAARAATFQILQPFTDLWNPYKLHLDYGPSGRDYLKKPWIWYTTPCYQDKAPGMAAEIYDQIRSVLRQPADCRGTAFFAPYYPWRDPWDTAYEHIKDVSVFMLPTRHGPVATPSWEAILEAVQHANLARMVRERARPEDTEAKALWERGWMEEILTWLETHGR